MGEQKKERTSAKRWLKGLKIAFGVFVGFWVILLLGIHFFLHSAMFPRTVSRLAGDYIDGDLEIGRLEASVFRHFPNIHVETEDLRLTYPHDRFAAYDSVGIAGILREAGRGSQRDTLAAFRNFSLTLDLSSALRGRFRIRSVELDGARIYAHQYDSATANWQILTFLQTQADTAADTASTPLPHIRIDKAALTGRPRIVFTSPSDTLFASLRTESIRFDGRLMLRTPLRSRIGLDIDSLFFAGRLPSDTVAIALDHFRLHSRRKGIFDIDAGARAGLAMGGIGRIRLPVGLKAGVSFPEQDFRTISIRDLELSAATLPLTGQADIRILPDSLFVRAEVAMRDCPVQETLRYFSQILDPEMQKLRTDAKLSVTALCDGWYIPESRTLPDLIAEISLPSARFSWQGLGSGRLGGLFVAQTDGAGSLSASADDLDIDFAGICLTGSGFAEDLLSEDPLIGIDLEAQADLDKLNDWLPDGMTARGRVNAALSGMAMLSDLDLHNFYRADFDGHVTSQGIFFADDPDSLTAFLGNTDIRLDKSPDEELGTNILGLTARVDTLHVRYGSSTFVRGSRLQFDARNAAETLNEEFGREFHPVIGSVAARGIAMTGSDSLFVAIRNTSNTFRYGSRDRDGIQLPHLSLTSRNGRIFLRQKTERVSLADVTLSASAIRKEVRVRGRRRSAVSDTLTGAGRGRTADGRSAGRIRQGRAGAQEDDFRGKDLDIRLDSAMSRYVRDWDLNCQLNVGEGRLLTPYLPLHTTISQVRGSMDTDQIRLESMNLAVGRSDISAQGAVTGLRRALLRNGTIHLDFGVEATMLDVNELISAFDAGSKFRPGSTAGALDETESDAQYFDRIAADADSGAQPGTSLVVIPSNVTADIHLQGDAIRYTNLDINWFASDIVMKDRTLQITNTVAMSNMGDIYFEGFYSTQNKRDLTAGFNLNLVDITAEKVITLIPAVDSIIPMLKSFKGLLDCEMTATSRLDTTMNLIPESIRGVMRIGGTGLSIQESGELRKIAKLLLFKDTKIGHIDDMSVEGVIGDNTLEIFPFILGVDRYQFALSGLQNFDQSFDYHLSVLKSPIPFRFGIDVYGNFDKWHYRIGKARYKSMDVPVFTTRIDTLQYNLVSSIHDIFNRGVDAALRQTRTEQESLRQAMEDVLGPIESLPEDEQIFLDSLIYEQDHPLDSLATGEPSGEAAEEKHASGETSVRLSFRDRIRAFFCPRYREAIRQKQLSLSSDEQF